MMTPDIFRKDLARLLTDPPSPLAPFEPSLDAYQSRFHETDDSEKLLRAIFAAGMLAYGDLSAVEAILEYDPEIAPGTATGIMIAAPSLALTIMLPLPESLKTTHRTVIDRELFIGWFEANRHALVLSETTGRFEILTSPNGT